jgi:hypothetical protein
MKEEPNIEYIIKLVGYDNELKARLIDLLKNEFPEDVETYNKNITLGNYNLAAENVHKLNHKIALLGFEVAYDMAQEYERQLRKGSTENKTQFEIILLKIQIFLNKLQNN